MKRPRRRRDPGSQVGRTGLASDGVCASVTPGGASVSRSASGRTQKSSGAALLSLWIATTASRRQAVAPAFPRGRLWFASPSYVGVPLPGRALAGSAALCPSRGARRPDGVVGLADARALRTERLARELRCPRTATACPSGACSSPRVPASSSWVSWLAWVQAPCKRPRRPRPLLLSREGDSRRRRRPTSPVAHFE